MGLKQDLEGINVELIHSSNPRFAYLVGAQGPLEAAGDVIYFDKHFRTSYVCYIDCVDGHINLLTRNSRYQFKTLEDIPDFKYIYDREELEDNIVIAEEAFGVDKPKVTKHDS